jgi:hypothetical protein
MPTRDEIESTEQPMPRADLIELVARAHRDSAYGDSSVAGRTLAAQSKLPKVIAENLGAGFGQWDFFPEASEIVDFAVAYQPPATEEDLWTMARSWASDEAASRPTLLALVGREILQHELRRIEIPQLRAVVDEVRPLRARELRTSLGLEVAPLKPAKAEAKRSRPSAVSPPTQAAVAAPSAPPATAAAPKREIPTRMPKPAFKAPTKAPPVVAKRFQHPKFGEGVLQAQDGAGPDAKLTIKFEAGSKTLLARYVTELPA